jgi:sarcosine oxidase subunit beta
VAALAGVDVDVQPHKRHVFTTEAFALPATPPFVVDLATTLYFHPEGDGLLLGMSDHGDAPTYDTSTDWGFLERIVERASHRIPSLENAAMRTGWAGLYEVTPDNQAVIGESDVHGFWLCCGFSGHGFMQAPAAGMLLAQRITGEPTEIDIESFSPQRFTRGESRPLETAVI